GHAPAPTQPGRAGETHHRPTPALARTHHQQQGPQTPAAHPDRRHHAAPRNQPHPSTYLDPLAHRFLRPTPRRPATATPPPPRPPPPPTRPTPPHHPNPPT